MTETQQLSGIEAVVQAWRLDIRPRLKLLCLALADAGDSTTADIAAKTGVPADRVERDLTALFNRCIVDRTETGWRWPGR